MPLPANNSNDPLNSSFTDLAKPTTPDPLDVGFAELAQQPIGNLTSWGDVIGDLIIDQLDPINLSLLVASFPAGGFAFRAASKLMGAAQIGGHAVRIAPNALTTAGAAVGGRFLPGARVVPELARGAGFSAPFAAAELVETPPEGSTRLGEAGSMMAFNTLIDVGLITVGIPVRFLGKARREAARTLAHSLAQGATEARAASDAFVAKIETLRSHGVPDDLIESIIQRSKEGITEDTPALLTRLLEQHGPAVFSRAQKFGLNPDQVRLGFQEFIERSTSEATLSKWAEEGVDRIITQAPQELLQRMMADSSLAQTVSKDLTTIFEPLRGRGLFPIQVNAAIKRLAKMGFDENTLRAVRTERVAPAPEKEAARAEMTEILDSLKPPTETAQTLDAAEGILRPPRTSTQRTLDAADELLKKKRVVAPPKKKK